MTLNITSQGRYLLDLLRTGPKTPSDLYAAGIKSPSSAISKLHGAGVRIAAKRVTGTNCYGKERLVVAEYQLAGSPGSDRAQQTTAVPPQPTVSLATKPENSSTINTFSQIWHCGRPVTARDGLILIDRHDKEAMASLPMWVDADACRIAQAFEERFIAVNTFPNGRTTTGIGSLAIAALYWYRLPRDEPRFSGVATLLTDINTQFEFTNILRALMNANGQGTV